MHIKDMGEIHEKRLLGEILIERKKITPLQLEQALNVKDKEGGYIGEILVKLGFIEEQDIIAALVVQCHLPYIAIDRYEITREITALIPHEMASRHCIVPLDRVGNVLSLVMLDPLDVTVKTDVYQWTRCRIAPFISTRKEIEQAIRKSYGDI